jgi:hypothetical protein
MTSTRARSSPVASHRSNLHRLEIEDLISYGRQGEQQRVQATLELFRRKEIRLVRKKRIAPEGL